MRSRALSAPFDFAIVGSGFAGSLIAMIARRLGRSVLLLERSRHPRFAIGESTTPLTNLLMERLARDYDLPRVASLCKWGSWQREHADLAVGLKRGFSFFHHCLDTPFAGQSDRSDQLLVAASPHDAIADTHWYRPDLDHFLVGEAQAMGVDYRDCVKLDDLEQDEEGITLLATRNGLNQRFRANFIIDASGPHSFLHRALSLPELHSENLPRRRAFFTHFRGVRRLTELPNCRSTETPPFAADDAAVHHVFDGGWIWVLQFNNGVTSAGAVVTESRAAELGLGEGADAWRMLLDRLPTVAAQFEGAVPQQKFTHVRNLGFRSATCVGDRWAMLPSAAGFADPLLSSGFPLTLLGVSRLAVAIKRDWGTPRIPQTLKQYERQTLEELDATERLVGALYASMRDFPLFASISRLYFAAASFSETVQRLDGSDRAGGYLMHDDPQFGPMLRAVCDQARDQPDAFEREELMKRVDAAIEPFDVAGLGRRERRNWYPVDAADLLDAAAKLGASRNTLEQLLRRTGFFPD